MSLWSSASKTASCRATACLVGIPVPRTAAQSAWSDELQQQSLMPTGQGMVIVASTTVSALGCPGSTWMGRDASYSSSRLASATGLTAHAQAGTIRVWQSSFRANGSTHCITAWLNC
jgi:hypothetical protein